MMGMAGGPRKIMKQTRENENGEKKLGQVGL
jgi:hypothetical protein